MSPLPDYIQNVSNDLRSIGDVLFQISRRLHEQTHRLQVAVEGRFAGEGANPRVQLLTDALQLSRFADSELTKINQLLFQLQQSLQLQHNGVRQGSPTGSFDQEREALSSSITDLEQRRNELVILYEIARTLNSTREFDEVLRLVMDRVIEFVNAERGFLMLINPQSGEPEFKIARDKEARSIPESAFSSAQISRGIVKRVIGTMNPIVTDDAQLDDELKGQASVMAFGIRSVMCAPLIVRDKCIGVVYVDSRVNANLFGPKHRDLLFAFCNQAAIAIDNARLFADLTRAIQQVQEDKQYMDNIFRSIANGVITADSNGILTTFNLAASSILNMHPIIGKHYQEVFSILPQVGLVPLFTGALMQPEEGTFITRSVDCEIEGRGEVNLNFYISSLRDPQGTPIGTALVIDDRTELTRSEARAKQLRDIFERYVHPNVVQQLVQDPMALNLGGETRELSIVFADIRGYTRLSESMAPEEVMNLINRYLKIMCEAIWEEEGTLTAFQGDALMAIFNAPLPQKTHALRAVRAAWKMRLAVQEYQQARPQETMVSFGFGVNTGLATVGNVGSQGRMQNYTAIGDAVNVASRLQTNVSDNNILLNHSTYIQVYRYVRVGKPFHLTVKNKSTPLTVRYLMGLL